MKIPTLLYYISVVSLSHAYNTAASESENNINLMLSFNNCFHDVSSENKCWQNLLIEAVPEKMYDFGVHYANGDGVKQDFTKGRYWIHKAALSGYPLAQYNLGVMFFDGIGGIQSQRCATHWLDKAALDEGDTGLMARQALQAVSEFPAQSSVRVYRPMTGPECEQLPISDFLEEYHLTEDESRSLTHEAQQEQPAFAEQAWQEDAQLTFNVGLDVLVASTLEQMPPVRTANEPPILPAFTLAPQAEVKAPPIFREKMGQYFVSLGHALLGQADEQTPYAENRHDIKPETSIETSQTPEPEREVASFVVVENTPDKPRDSEGDNANQTVRDLEQESPLFVARVLEHSVRTLYDSLDLMAAPSASQQKDVVQSAPMEVETYQAPVEAQDLPHEDQASALGTDRNIDAASPIAVPPIMAENVPLKRDTCPSEGGPALPIAPEEIKTEPKLVAKKVVRPLNLGGALKNAPKSHYTLQLSSASQAEPLLALAKKQKLSNYLVYETQRHGRRWYVLVYGEYAGMTQAKQALQQLPSALKKDTPWIRSLAHVHTEL
jgi:septal ring-binding cell division protein DamX